MSVRVHLRMLPHDFKEQMSLCWEQYRPYTKKIENIGYVLMVSQMTEGKATVLVVPQTRN